MFFNRAQAATMWFDRDKLRRISSQLRDTSRSGLSTQEDTVPGSIDSSDPRSSQRMLWIDDVGGYLICLADELVLGQPDTGVGASGPDLPILADLSRRHVRLRREAGGYLILPHGPTWIDERGIEGPTLLAGGEEIRLGESVRLRFTRPHALSATAKLTLLSGHRTTPSADGVLLMAESCVLGPKPHSHIRCAKWENEAILFRGAGGLYCRSSSPLRSGDGPAADSVKVSPGTRIEGQDFAMSIERVGEA